MSKRGLLHHIELWVHDLPSAEASWGWLLSELGYTLDTRWETGQTWRRDDTYIVLERSSDLTHRMHDRCRAGVNHLSFHAGTVDEVEALVKESREHGWTLLFPERHPFAGGSDHYAAYLENRDGFEVELVAE